MDSIAASQTWARGGAALNTHPQTTDNKWLTASIEEMLFSNLLSRVKDDSEIATSSQLNISSALAPRINLPRVPVALQQCISPQSTRDRLSSLQSSTSQQPSSNITNIHHARSPSLPGPKTSQRCVREPTCNDCKQTNIFQPTFKPLLVRCAPLSDRLSMRVNLGLTLTHRAIRRLLL